MDYPCHLLALLPAQAAACRCPFNSNGNFAEVRARASLDTSPPNALRSCCRLSRRKSNWKQIRLSEALGAQEAPQVAAVAERRKVETPPAIRVAPEMELLVQQAAPATPAAATMVARRRRRRQAHPRIQSSR